MTKAVYNEVNAWDGREKRWRRCIIVPHRSPRSPRSPHSPSHAVEFKVKMKSDARGNIREEDPGLVFLSGIVEDEDDTETTERLPPQPLQQQEDEGHQKGGGEVQQGKEATRVSDPSTPGTARKEGDGERDDEEGLGGPKQTAPGIEMQQRKTNLRRKSQPGRRKSRVREAWISSLLKYFQKHSSSYYVAMDQARRQSRRVVSSSSTSLFLSSSIPSTSSDVSAPSSIWPSTGTAAQARGTLLRDGRGGEGERGGENVRIGNWHQRFKEMQSEAGRGSSLLEERQLQQRQQRHQQLRQRQRHQPPGMRMVRSFRSNSLPFYTYQSQDEESETTSYGRDSDSKMTRCQSMPSYDATGYRQGGALREGDSHNSGTRRRGSEGNARQTSRLKRHFAPLPTSLMAAYRKKHGGLGWHEEEGGGGGG